MSAARATGANRAYTRAQLETLARERGISASGKTKRQLIDDIIRSRQF